MGETQPDMVDQTSLMELFTGKLLPGREFLSELFSPGHCLGSSRLSQILLLNKVAAIRVPFVCNVKMYSENPDGCKTVKKKFDSLIFLVDNVSSTFRVKTILQDEFKQWVRAGPRNSFSFTLGGMLGMVGECPADDCCRDEWCLHINSTIFDSTSMDACRDIMRNTAASLSQCCMPRCDNKTMQVLKLVNASRR